MKKGWIAVILLFFLLFPVFAVRAEDGEDGVTEYFLSELPLKDLDAMSKELLDEEGLSFSEMVGKLVKGEMPLGQETVKQLAVELFFGEAARQKDTAVRILLLLIGAGLFSTFAAFFEKSEIQNVTFFMIYLALFAILTAAFYQLSTLAEETIGKLLSFMKLLMPSYLMVSVFSGNSISGMAFYELILGILFLVQWIYKNALLPGANLYFLLVLLNHLSGEDYLSKLAGLLKDLVEWALKSFSAAVLGIQAIQGLILPAVDGMKNTLLYKTGESIPVLGNLFGGVSEVVMGAGVLIKNGVGTAGLILLLLLCLAPAARLFLAGCMYRLLAAVAQPVTDKRLTDCLEGIGQGTLLLLKIVLGTGLLFFVSMALALSATGK
ncbi:MAG TPA: stage III sporulation protein AE [Candidatus Limivivens merdigallinarum]|uniref:Stage III sporulation protein AE n=1 Tax=Candidatus Limivivens merdigallinarum TaxID=2840859 RepID=A0A9D0ZY74_9FIRM|nr:stage III sporulation protein AE [Candidatus Limivivens merdigallinarum]